MRACKFVVIPRITVFAALRFCRIVSDQRVAVLLSVFFLDSALVLIVVTGTVIAGYRAVRADGPLTACLADCPIYAVVRAGRTVVAILAIWCGRYRPRSAPHEPMTGPGAVGILFIEFALGLRIRTLAEYYYPRRDFAVRLLT